jgi:hypothetical protein
MVYIYKSVHHTTIYDVFQVLANLHFSRCIIRDEFTSYNRQEYHFACDNSSVKQSNNWNRTQKSLGLVSIQFEFH